jgi:hypothetical protein
MFLEQERELNIFWDNTKKALTKKKKTQKANNSNCEFMLDHI